MGLFGTLFSGNGIIRNFNADELKYIVKTTDYLCDAIPKMRDYLIAILKKHRLKSKDFWNDIRNKQIEKKININSFVTIRNNPPKNEVFLHDYNEELVNISKKNEEILKDTFNQAYIAACNHHYHKDNGNDDASKTTLMALVIHLNEILKVIKVFEKYHRKLGQKDVTGRMIQDKRIIQIFLQKVR